MASRESLLENLQTGQRNSRHNNEDLLGGPFLNLNSSAKKCKFNEPNQFVNLLFKCPQLESDKVMTRSDWRTQISRVTEEMKKRDPLQAAVIEIKSFNHITLVEKCLGSLENYLKKILDHPNNHVYRYIDVEDREFRENVKPAEGAVFFLTSLGFRRLKKNWKEFLVFYDYLYREDFNVALHLLHKVKGFQLELDRDCRVFTEPAVDGDVFLLSDFFEMGPGEADVEGRLRSYQKAKGAGIRTRNLYRLCREKGRPLYARVWVRLGGGKRVEGTFAADEKLSAVREMVEGLVDIGKNSLTAPELYLERNAEEKSLAELGLVPVASLNIPLFPSHK